MPARTLLCSVGIAYLLLIANLDFFHFGRGVHNHMNTYNTDIIKHVGLWGKVNQKFSSVSQGVYIAT